MTIERIKGAVAFTCDLQGCHEGLETGERDFADANAQAKAEGWVFAQRHGDWKHFCSAEHERADFRLRGVTK